MVETHGLKMNIVFKQIDNNNSSLTPHIRHVDIFPRLTFIRNTSNNIIVIRNYFLKIIRIFN